MKKFIFGNLGGRDVYAYTLTDGELSVTLTEYGAAIQSIKLGDRELVLGYGDIASYAENRSYFGATIGRIANRVAGGRFTIGSRTFTLDKNDNNNSLHGGFDGYDRRVFDSRVDGDGVLFTLVSGDGDQGLDGTFTLKVKYRLSGGALKIEYEGVCDKDTAWNPTNHTFFNLGGSNEPVYNTVLYINAVKFTPVDGDLIPTGEIKDVKGTPFDFTKPKKIGADIFEKCRQLECVGGGYDHNFVLGEGLSASAEYGGVRLELYTDMCGLQFYTGNFLKGERVRGMQFAKHTAFCLEPQFFPNSVNESRFPSPVLRAGETGRHFIEYRLSKIPSVK